MTHFKSILLAGAIAVSGAVTASDADALFVDGVFDIEIYNFNANQAASSATETSITNALANSGSNNLATDLDVVWDGALDFSYVTAQNAPNQTIESFFLSSVGGGTVSNLDLGGNTLSASGYATTTLFKITARTLRNISDASQIFFVKHDDGVTLTGSTGGTYASPAPTTANQTSPNVSGLSGGGFTLIYAAANGNPSVLQVNAIPLPAAAWLLLGVSGALVAAKRRSARRDA